MESPSNSVIHFLAMCVLLFCNNLLTVYCLSFGSSNVGVQARDGIFVQMFWGPVPGPDRQAGLPPAVRLLPSRVVSPPFLALAAAASASSATTGTVITPVLEQVPPQAVQPAAQHARCPLPMGAADLGPCISHCPRPGVSSQLMRSAPLSHQTSSTEHEF